jgi:ubiquinone/menaquinone biosynthesis C-methylase UbiE
MEQDLNKIEELYDTIAKEYTEAFYGEHERKPKDQEILYKFCQMIGHRKPVWDFGCGPGQTTKFIKNLGVDISGLDLSGEILKQARKINPEICFQKGDILKLDFKDNSISGVVSFYSIVHFTKKQVKKAFHEVFRVLQPNGIFLFTYHIGNETVHVNEFNGKKIDIDFMFFTTDFIFSCLKEIGYHKIKIIEREPYPEGEYQSRRAYIFAIKPCI